jgi:Kef-type K+ transport system membrane component KefB
VALTLSLGILFLAGLAAVILAERLGVPRVTLYIVVGLLIGPSLLNWIPHEHLEEFDPVLKLALAMVLLEIGSRFTFASFRQIIPAAVPLSIGELAVTLSLVTLGVWAVSKDWEFAILLGGLALATAPATTIVVLRDYDAEGPVTALTYALVALNNLAAIVAFEILFVLVSLFSGPEGAESISGGGARLGWLATDLIGSLAAGILAGFLATVLMARLSGQYRTLAVLSIVTVVLGICESLSIPYLLTFLAMGVTLANTSASTQDLFRNLEPIAALLYVVFFVASGAETDIRSLWAVGGVGAVYIATRCAGKYLGVWVSARLTGEPQAVRRWLGMTLIAQAGAAIGLVQVATDRDPDLGGRLQTIIVGTVVFFEVLGPILTRTAVIHAGEIPLAQLFHPDRMGWLEACRAVVSQVRQAFGGEPWTRRTRESLTVSDLMRKNVQTLSPSDDFLKVLDLIEHSRHLVYPVVEESGKLLGMIRYGEIRSALFHPELAMLVRAEDLSRPIHSTLTPDQSIEEALSLVRDTSDEAIPVVAGRDDLTLVGMIERRDVARFIKRNYHRSGS